jgi:hypothetical protein
MAVPRMNSQPGAAGLHARLTNAKGTLFCWRQSSLLATGISSSAVLASLREKMRYEKRGRDARDTQGQDALATRNHGQDARATSERLTASLPTLEMAKAGPCAEPAPVKNSWQSPTLAPKDYHRPRRA